MALRGTLTHRKTRKLAALLGVDWCVALGLLEALWHVTSEQQPDGGVGRMSDQSIAEEMFYTGKPEALMWAFKEAGWLDAHEGCRLFVHDWHEHADDQTQQKVLRRGNGYFANGEPSKRLKKQAVSEFVRETQTNSEKLRPPVLGPVLEPDMNIELPKGSKREFEGRTGEDRTTLRVETTTEQNSLREEPPPTHAVARGGTPRSMETGWHRAGEGATRQTIDSPRAGNAPTEAAQDAQEGLGARNDNQAGQGDEAAKKARKAVWQRLRECCGTVAGMRAYFEELEQPESQGVIAGWQADYPGVDVRGEIVKARDWLEARVGAKDEPLDGFSLIEGGAKKYRPWAYWMAWLKNQARDREDPTGRAIQRAGAYVKKGGGEPIRGAGGEGAGDDPGGWARAMARPLSAFKRAASILRTELDSRVVAQWLVPCSFVLDQDRVIVFAPSRSVSEKVLDAFESALKHAFGVDHIEAHATAQVVEVA